MVPCLKREEVESYTYEVSFDLYNSSGNAKIMRNIQIVFTDSKNGIEKQTPKDEATKNIHIRDLSVMLSSLLIFHQKLL